MRLARLARIRFQGRQAISLVVLAALGLALALEEAQLWPGGAHVFGAIGIMFVLVIMPAWLPVTAVLGGAMLAAGWWRRRGSGGSRGGA